MFEIDENNLPFVRTRQALLIIDLQNEFVSTGYQLLVDQPPGFVGRILELLPEFRKSGNIIWIRSLFETSRPVNGSGDDSEQVITDQELSIGLRGAEQVRKERPAPSQNLLKRHGKIAEANGRGAEFAALMTADKEEEDEDPIAETFLTVPPGGMPRYVLADSPSTNLSPAAAIGYDCDNDIVYSKTCYSAFKDGSLVQTLRAKFVTEIYICGALTNISVFATVMDAAQYGLAITIVEDCLGYRSKARHDEALRRLTEFTGCDIVSSEELMEGLQIKSRVAPRAPPPRRPQPSQPRVGNFKSPNLESMMSKLNLESGGSTVPRTNAAPTRPSVNASLAERSGSETCEPLLSSESHEVKPPTAATETPRQPRERVKTTIKTRRRLKPVTGENGRLSENGAISSTSATLMAAAHALEKLTNATDNDDDLEAAANSAADAAAKANEVEIDVEPLNQPTRSTMLKYKKDNESDRTNGAPLKECTVITPPSDLDADGELDGSTPICESDTTVIKDLLKKELAEGIFEKIRDEVRWQKMSHQGGDVPRLVAVQGEISEDGSIPIYRHPADESPPLLPFSPTVSLIQKEVEKKLGHAVNHVLIQFYRDGTDYISEHSDKTLDIVPKTFIANVSLGAQRTMVFRTKKKQPKTNGSSENPEPQVRETVRAPLPHNSMCKVGLVTNMRWLHGIRQDKRRLAEKSESELAFNGARISLTFRLIGSFLSKSQDKIWGQGAVSKTKENARSVLNGNTPESKKMIEAFGKENHSSEFDWMASYGTGFDVQHISNEPKLFLSGDNIADSRVKIALAECGIEWVEGKLSPAFNWKDGSSINDTAAVPGALPVRFVDNDLSRSTVTGNFAIILYLDSVYGSHSHAGDTKIKFDLAKQFTRLYQTTDLLEKWRTEPFSVKPFKRDLELWETYAAEGEFIAAEKIGLADYALWPILDEIYAEWGFGEGLENLAAYYQRVKERDGVMKAIDDSEE